MPTIMLNGVRLMFDVSPDMPLLWAIRDVANLTGTKYGCGAGICGACTVHVNGEAQRACQTPIGSVDGSEVTTIEGLSKDRSHPVQQAWIELQVPQCGYCQTGMIMAATAFLAANPKPSEEDVIEAITNLCRCGTYPRIKKAVLRAAELRDEELEAAAESAKEQVRSEKKAARDAARNAPVSGG